MIMMEDQELSLEEQALNRTRNFRIENSGQFSTGNIPNGKVIGAVKRLIFENSQAEDLDLSKSGRQTVLKNAVKYIVEEIMELTPAQYDALYSSGFNQQSQLDHAIRKIAMGAPASIRKHALFDSKAILFATCWPEYYEEHFPKPTAYRIFNASGDVKSNLSRAGRPKSLVSEMEETKILNNGNFSTARKERKRVYTYGEEVDQLVYGAMKEMLSVFEVSTKELFDMLANPKRSGLARFGCFKVIEKRECYPTALDFYMWNSPVKFQLYHMTEYMEARKKSGAEPIAMLNAMYETYMEDEYEIDIDK